MAHLRPTSRAAMRCRRLLPLPLLALALALPPVRRHLTDRARLQVVLLTGVLHAGVVVLTVWQAQRGEPLLSPSAPVLAAAGVLLLLAVSGAAAIARTGRPAPAADEPSRVTAAAG